MSQPDGGSNAGSESITYFGTYGPDPLEYDPIHLFRRSLGTNGTLDEECGRNGVWVPTSRLQSAERGELVHDDAPLTLFPIVDVFAASRERSWRNDYQRRLTDLERQAGGHFPLSYARTTDVARGPDGLPAYREEPMVGQVAAVSSSSQRRAMVDFLSRAPRVAAGVPQPDPVDPARTMPTGIRTDGRWVWAESTTHLLEHHGVPPAGGLILHMQDRGWLVPDAVSAEVTARAAALAERARTDSEPQVEEAVMPDGTPVPSRDERLRALARWHHDWGLRHANSTPNLSGDAVHHVDLDASPEAAEEFIRRAREIMGQDPETGRQIY